LILVVTAVQVVVVLLAADVVQLRHAAAITPLAKMNIGATMIEGIETAHEAQMIVGVTMMIGRMVQTEMIAKV
jgi:hypothetical protein